MSLPGPHCDKGELFQELWNGGLERLQGDVAEFGVYRGGTTRQLSDLTGRTVWAFDTFEGIPGEDYAESDDEDVPGKFKSEYNMEEMFGEYPRIVPVVGRFADTLLDFDEAVKFVLVYMDCDLKASTHQVLEWLPQHLVDGAAIVFDDYSSHKNVRAEVNEFGEKHGCAVTPRGNGAHIIWRA